MTLEGIKNDVAARHGWGLWVNVRMNFTQLENLDMMVNEIAELYAKSKWDEACKAQRDSCVQAYYNNEHHDEDVAIENAAKPVFIP